MRPFRSVCLFSMDLEQERAFLAQRHPSNLEHDDHSINHELATSPLFTASALQSAGAAIFPLRGLLGATTDDDLIYFNTNSPSSGVVCGVQGSGKSHTVSCLLENALVKDARTGNLSQPLAALVFHFDEQDGDRPCEAAYLGSPATADDAHVKRITVLTSSVNIANRRRTYAHLPNVDVQPLLLGDADITAPRLLALMGMSDDAEKTMPLYMKTILQIVRDIGPDGFSYTEFKLRTKRERFDSTQRIMLAHRLRLLDAFVQSSSRPIRSYFAPGDMVLVDLTDPFLNGEFASLLFDIVLGSFMGWNSPTGRIVVLDEAHKYLTNSKSSRLNRSIATIIRQQRHLATRVIIATQEPTVIPDTVLDLSSFVVCHRFTSPSWCSHLSRHVSTQDQSWFKDVMNLPTGDAIIFSPAARTTETLAPLGTEALHIKVRPRLTSDGGASVMAIDSATRLPLKEKSTMPVICRRLLLKIRHLIHA
ncbi:P-loop containing nucleoside triphosphate hydrolase protein [Auriculariales sp. MPI-PUGE-AT-0066]|nr:P-loop containing nucleoside triphosphate hydrolase protein [Auriculariales sp. MPI-PUGE-AT-0066]